MNYIEISFIFLNQRDFGDILAARLNEIEFESYIEIEDGLAAYIHEDFLDQKKLDSVVYQSIKYMLYFQIFVILLEAICGDSYSIAFGDG